VIPDILLRVFFASAATVAFSVMFYIPRKELLFAGVTAGVGWFVYEMTLVYQPEGVVLASFAATLAISVGARIWSYLRRSPVIIYLVGGIIPIVPGAGIYNTMYSGIIEGATMDAIEQGIQTLKIAGVIAFGIVFILSLPGMLFDLRRPSKK
jgi:uncharacterized membrane protein YjjB (DUF3815 family)